MALVTYIILLSCLNFTLAKDCIINNMPEVMASEIQLKKDLKCNYKALQPPIENMTFPVNVKFVMRRFNFESDEEVLSIQSWMFVTWKDDRLKWDPNKYYGINETEFSSFRIWTPGFTLYNSADSNDFDRYFYTYCHVKHTGKVICAPRVTHQVSCSVKLTNWPYDQQNCKFELGPWISKWNNFSMNVSSKAISMFGAEYGAEWYISDYRQEFNLSAKKQLTMTFVLDREAGGLAAIVVYPSIILTTLSITSLFIDVRHPLRLAIACFSVFGHYYFLMELADNLPKHSDYPPSLLFYYRGSVILTVLIILFTFSMAAVCKLKCTPQNYFMSINDYVYDGYWKYFIFPWDFDDDLRESKQFNQDWTKFAKIINSVFLFVIIIAYITLYCTLMPKPISVNY